MTLYSVKTQVDAAKVIEAAVAYFGEGGLGLEVEQQEDCCAYFVGGGGHVRVTADGDGETEVDLETREWDFHVKKFMRQIS